MRMENWKFADAKGFPEPKQTDSDLSLLLAVIAGSHRKTKSSTQNSEVGQTLRPPPPQRKTTKKKPASITYIFTWI